MKKSLLVAAALITATTGVQLTQVAKASPQFKVTAASPGSIDFTGSGTAQFNNQIGTNNSFQVGSSTNLGVNASAHEDRLLVQLHFLHPRSALCTFSQSVLPRYRVPQRHI